MNLIITILLLLAAIWVAVVAIGSVAMGIWAIIRLPIEIIEFLFDEK